MGDRDIIYFDRKGNGPYQHKCPASLAAPAVRDWLDRKKLTGIDPVAVKAIEEMIEDLR